MFKPGGRLHRLLLPLSSQDEGMGYLQSPGRLGDYIDKFPSCHLTTLVMTNINTPDPSENGTVKGKGILCQTLHVLGFGVKPLWGPFPSLTGCKR